MRCFGNVARFTCSPSDGLLRQKPNIARSRMTDALGASTNSGLTH